MFRIGCHAGFLLSLIVGFAASAGAQTGNQNWMSLDNEMSRTDIFRRYQQELATNLKAAGQSFAFPAGFTFAHDAVVDTGAKPPKNRENEIFGIDISHYEGSKFPLCNLKRQQVSFIYIKATQGTRYADPVFDHNWNGWGTCADQQIPRGAYHFLSSNPAMTGKDQADSFVNYVKQHGKMDKDDLAPAMDLEWDVACKNCPDQWQTNHRTPAEIVQTARDFIDEVSVQLKRTPLIYTNKVFLKAEGITDPSLITKLIGSSKVWIFDLDSRDRAVELPNPNSNLAHALWQFSFTGKLTSGYSGTFDVNVFNTSAGAFPAFLTGGN